MKILFLDVDGVLNCRHTFQRRHDAWKASGNPVKEGELTWPLGHLDEELVPRLNTIIEQTGCKIVVSSSWRLSGDFQYFAGWLVHRGFKHPEAIIDRTPSMPYVESNCRGEEIKAWLDKHPDVVKYAILDDDVEDITPLHPNNTVQTSGTEGLTEERAQLAISLLNA